MGVYTDIKADYEHKIGFYTNLKESLLAVKDTTSAVERTYCGFTCTTDTGIKGFCEAWRTANPTSDGSADDNDLQLYSIWNAVKDLTDDELYAEASNIQTIIDQYNTKVPRIQKIIDEGEPDPCVGIFQNPCPAVD